ncbi:MAG: polysaccharide deacetylase family protein [Acidimicrobiia bacterium]
MDLCVTTSWDDGHRLDERLAGLLERYGIAGTFYVAPDNREFAPRDRLAPGGVVELAERFEIGGHTRRHVVLTSIDPRTARTEIMDGKLALEELIARPVTSFCYPRGEFEANHVAIVREAGFTYGRTVVRHVTAPTGDPLRTPTTVHAYRHLRDVAAVARLGGSPRRMMGRFTSWDELAIARFDRMLGTGGVYHLWGHSWEVEQFGDWNRLERVLAHISRRDTVRYATNAESLSAARESRRRQ